MLQLISILVLRVPHHRAYKRQNDGRQDLNDDQGTKLRRRVASESPWRVATRGCGVIRRYWHIQGLPTGIKAV